MNLSRNFFVAGTAFLLVGICLGSYMGASQDHTLQPVHAHLNLLGFTLMMIFGLVYRAVPSMAASWMARAHLWLHGVGTAVLLTLLALYFTGTISPALMPLALPCEIAIFAGVVMFLVNLVRNYSDRTSANLYQAVAA